MAKITDKIKEKVTGAKDKMVETKDKAADKTEDTFSNKHSTETTTSYTTTTTGGSTKQYEAKEPMSPAKISEHEPTAVKREMTEKIADKKGTSLSPEEAREKARKSGMTKGTAGA